MIRYILNCFSALPGPSQPSSLPKVAMAFTTRNFHQHSLEFTMDLYAPHDNPSKSDPSLHVVGARCIGGSPTNGINVIALLAYLSRFTMLRVIVIVFANYKDLVSVMFPQRESYMQFNRLPAHCRLILACDRHQLPDESRDGPRWDRVDIDPDTLYPTGASLVCGTLLILLAEQYER